MQKPQSLLSMQTTTNLSFTDFTAHCCPLESASSATAFFELHCLVKTEPRKRFPSPSTPLLEDLLLQSSEAPFPLGTPKLVDSPTSETSLKSYKKDLEVIDAP